jgi:ADP-heptose:LPS heptosyltransferase
MLLATGRHETERNHSLLQKILNVSLTKPALYPSKSDDSLTVSFKQKAYVTMAPASVWYTKQLPHQKWVELCNRMPADVNICLIGAPSDAAMCERIKSDSVNPNISNLAGKFSLLQTASLMKDAKMNFVNDSGPLHIASSMNAPVTAFFCSTVPAFGFGPLSDHSAVIETESELKCRPCGLHGKKIMP